MKREWDTENTEDTAEDGSPSPSVILHFSTPIFLPNIFLPPSYNTAPIILPFPDPP